MKKDNKLEAQKPKPQIGRTVFVRVLLVAALTHFTNG